MQSSRRFINKLFSIYFLIIILIALIIFTALSFWSVKLSPLICSCDKKPTIVIHELYENKKIIKDDTTIVNEAKPTIVAMPLTKAKPIEVSLTTQQPPVPNFVLENNEWFPAGVYGDNITGYPMLIVPNIVHYVLFSIRVITFSHLISILSVLKHQKPDEIMIHCDCDSIGGENWDRIKDAASLVKTKITIRRVEKPEYIFGRKINPDVRNWHGSDILRWTVLLEFGGIYLDTDVYVCKSLDVFRKYEMTLNWDEGQYLGSQVLMGNKNARFLKWYRETYRWYDQSKWYYNAGELPTTSILYKYPQLVHRVKVAFGVDAPVVCPKIFREYYPKWRDEFWTVHMTLRDHAFAWPDWCFGKNYPPVMTFDKNNVKTLNVTFGEMARLVLYGTKDYIRD